MHGISTCRTESHGMKKKPLATFTSQAPMKHLIFRGSCTRKETITTGSGGYVLRMMEDSKQSGCPVKL
jgi:hypothetical protein